MRKVLPVLLLLALVLGAAVPTLAQDDATVYVRFAHFAAGAGDVDLYIDGTVADVLAFGEVSEWTELPARTYSVALAPVGTTPGAAVITADVALEAGTWVTASAIGSVELGGGQIHLIEEDYSPINEAETRLTLFHAVPNLGPVNLQLADGTPLVLTLAYPNTIGENNGYATLDLVSDTRHFQITPYDDTETVLFDLADVILAPGRSVFMAVAGLAADPISVMVVTDPATMLADGAGAAAGDDMADVDTGEGAVTVRVAHFAPGAGDADVYINGELSDARGLAFGDVTDFIELPAGIHEVAIVPAGGTVDDAAIEAQVALFAGETMTVAAVGAVEMGMGDVVAFVEDVSDITFGETRLTYMHAIQDLDPTNLQLDDGTVLFQTVAFPGALGDNDGTVTVDILEGQRTLQVTPYNDPSTVLLTLEGVTLAQGRHYLIAAIGTASDPLIIMEITQ